MRIRLLVRQTDFVLALLLSIVCTWASFEVCRKIIERQQRGLLLTESLIGGESQFEFLQGPECVGSLRITLDDDEGAIDFKASGELRLALEEQRVSFEIDASAAFTVMGQLSAAIFRLDSPSFVAGLGLLERDPIHVKLWAGKRREDFSRELVIPGPIEILRVGRGAFRLRYTPLARGGSLGSFPVFDAMQRLLRFEVRKLPAGTTACSNAHPGWMDMTAARLGLESLAKMGQGLLSQIPPGGNP